MSTDVAELKLPMLYRTAEITDVTEVRKKGSDRVGYEIAITSEYPVKRWFGTEILSHEKGAVDMTYAARGLSLLDNHFGDLIGIVEDIRLDSDKVLRGTAYFSKSTKGQEFEQDLKDRTRRFISAGYRPIKAIREEKGESPSNDKWRLTRWMPFEASLVPIPADPTVGPNRSGDRAVEIFPVEIEGGIAAKEGSMTLHTDGPTGKRTREQECAEIVKVCEANGMSRAAADFITRGLTLDQASREILEARGRSERPISTPASEHLDTLGGQDFMDTRDRRRYSYKRAIELAAGLVEGGLERDVHMELSRRMPGDAKRHGGILVPNDLRTPDEVWARALDTKTAAKGVEAVADQPGELIELLRTRTVVRQLGARFLPGLSGNVVFPRQTSGMTMHWMGENPAADVASSDLGLGTITLSPKTLMGTTSYSRQLLAQASLDVEGMVRAEIAEAHARAIDRAALHGKSTDREPTGIYATPDVQPKDMEGSVSYAKLVDMVALVADANAAIGSLGWVTTPLLAAQLMRTLVAAAAGSAMIWQGTIHDGELVGYQAIATGQVSKTMLEAVDDPANGTSQGLIFGNWGDLIVGLFAALEIVVDPYTLKKRGMIELTSFQMADVIIRHPKSFAVALNADLS